MSSSLIEKAKSLGFIAIGFSRPEKPLYLDQFYKWLSAHKNADMLWLERNREVREDPSILLKGCNAIISLAYPYPFQKPFTADGFSVSRYSHPAQKDYHSRLKKLCHELGHMVKEIYGGNETRICVDSAPILEKSLACSAGIGFIGKNNMLIIPAYGSYFYLAEILTTAPVEFIPVKAQKNQCGSCTLCIDSCPTGALERPFCLDASRCLSYLTIEHKEAVQGDIGIKMGDCFFGCDRCQEVCPFNRENASIQVLLPTINEFIEMTDEDFKMRFGKTALARAGLEKLKSNIRAIRT